MTAVPRSAGLNPFHGRGNSLGVPGISLTDGFVVEPSGDLLIANSGDVAHFDRVTRQTTTVTTDTFFSPNGIARGADGRVFITEFFEQLWEIDVAGSSRSVVPLFEDLSIPGLITVRSDGKLIVKNFDPNTLNIVDPDTGGNKVFSADLPTFVSDFTLDADDNLWLTSTEGVFRYDSSGGAKTLVFDDSFFNPGAIAVVPDGWVVVGLPEPTAACLLLLGLTLPLPRRRHV